MNPLVLPGLQAGAPQQTWKDDDGCELDFARNNDDQKCANDRNMRMRSQRTPSVRQPVPILYAKQKLTTIFATLHILQTYGNSSTLINTQQMKPKLITTYG